MLIVRTRNVTGRPVAIAAGCVIGTGRLLAWLGEQVIRVGHWVVRAGYRLAE